MGNMQMYANMRRLGRPEAQWEIKALWDGGGLLHGPFHQGYKPDAAVLNIHHQTERWIGGAGSAEPIHDGHL